MFTSHDLFQIILFLGLLTLMTPLLGEYMARVFSGQPHVLKYPLGWLENVIYKLTGVNPDEETNWKTYTLNLLWFNGVGIVFLFGIQLLQANLPLNPAGAKAVTWHTALNTAISFVTNTNWQSYAGETTLSYLVQMTGLTVQNFVSAATGIAVMLALIRGLTRKASNRLGNFWVDLTRSIVYILLPISIFFSVVLAGQGVIQNFKPYETVHTLQGGQQTIPMGPVASQVAIKQLGTNGGGYFNANSAHPFENPTPFTNFLEMLAILLIPSALALTYGKMIGSTRQGWVIFATMMLLFILGLVVSLYSEFSSNPLFGNMPLMEGKETRYGITNSVLWSVSTSAASSGSINSMHDSLSPLSGMVAMINIMLGEVIFGGVGAGIYGMVVFIMLTVFIAGLMVGRTPEYLGKKINAFEVKMAIIAILIPGFVILVFTAWASSVPAGLSALSNHGPHGFSEILYAFSSAAGNNGSAFAGLNSNTVFYNLTISIGMLLGRYGVIIPVMALAGNMAEKKITPLSAGTFRTDTVLFMILLVLVILIIGGLTFFPALSLGPIVEHILLYHGMVF